MMSVWVKNLIVCFGMLSIVGGACKAETSGDTEEGSSTSGDTDTDVDGDTDTDVDGDTDGDSDGDADTDADIDSDSDSDADTGNGINCTDLNSGYPCTCTLNPYFCDDGSKCTYVEGAPDIGGSYCAKPCTSTYECQQDAFGGQGRCWIGTPEQMYCCLVCETDDDCPNYQTCQFIGDGTSICHP